MIKACGSIGHSAILMLLHERVAVTLSAYCNLKYLRAPESVKNSNMLLEQNEIFNAHYRKYNPLEEVLPEITLMFIDR